MGLLESAIAEANRSLSALLVHLERPMPTSPRPEVVTLPAGFREKLLRAVAAAGRQSDPRRRSLTDEQDLEAVMPGYAEMISGPLETNAYHKFLSDESVAWMRTLEDLGAKASVAIEDSFLASAWLGRVTYASRGHANALRSDRDIVRRSFEDLLDAEKRAEKQRRPALCPADLTNVRTSIEMLKSTAALARSELAQVAGRRDADPPVARQPETAREEPARSVPRPRKRTRDADRRAKAILEYLDQSPGHLIASLNVMEAALGIDRATIGHALERMENGKHGEQCKIKARDRRRAKEKAKHDKDVQRSLSAVEGPRRRRCS